MKTVNIKNVILQFDIPEDQEVNGEFVEKFVKGLNDFINHHPLTSELMGSPSIHVDKSIIQVVELIDDTENEDDEYDFVDVTFEGTEKRVKLITEVKNGVVMVEDQEGNQWAQSINKLKALDY